MSTDEKIDLLLTKFDSLESKVDNLENRFDGLENRFDGLENRFDGLENRVNDLEEAVRENTVVVENTVKRCIEVITIAGGKTHGFNREDDSLPSSFYKHAAQAHS